MPRKCLFCGASADSKEHAVPAWLVEVVADGGRMEHRRHQEGIAWQAGGFDITVRRVCRRCNQTWMSDLESAARTLVAELVSAVRSSPLSASEQKLLSAWCWKTAAMLALAYPDESHYVPPDHYTSFYDQRNPPKGITAWVGGLLPKVSGTSETQTAWARPERIDFANAKTGELRAHGYRLSFSIGHMVYQGLWDPFGGRFERPRAYRDVWTRIQPASKGQWPPKRWLTQAGIEDLAGGEILSGPEP